MRPNDFFVFLSLMLSKFDETAIGTIRLLFFCTGCELKHFMFYFFSICVYSIRVLYNK